MKFLIDNNLSYKLVSILQVDFPGSMHVRDVLSVSADDLSIWEFAKHREFVILTKDNDFDERSQLVGCPPKVVHLICGNKTTLEIINLLQSRKDDLFAFGSFDKENCILKIAS